jgi:hypothetical protein
MHRLGWLLEVLDPDAGDISMARPNPTRNDGPLEKTLKRLGEKVLLRHRLLEVGAKERAVADRSHQDDPSFEWT